ncbi:MAG: hypothetical protein VR64_04245 [Desulfatitalea sp. BRH_c12]|nr:MAG: hypothetical protein VR64_04245 [Desulfatitalea sp. BRH_c12]
MKMLKIITMMMVSMFLVMSVNGLYADTSDQHHGKRLGTTEGAYDKPKVSEEMHSTMDRKTTADERKQCLTQATVIEMADGYGVTFTDKGAKFENAVSLPQRLQRAC